MSRICVYSSEDKSLAMWEGVQCHECVTGSWIIPLRNDSIKILSVGLWFGQIRHLALVRNLSC